MTQLPPALAPWAEQLAIFSRDVAFGLQPLLARLRAAIGPLSTSEWTGNGQPDGYDGITRRGHYERLLASEWLLASELPDEFLRRAAHREHLFLRTARTAPSSARSSRLLLDAGPSQLGGPRIVQLATLIVFARRAAEAHARLEWGIVQKPADGWRSGVTTESIRAFLAAPIAIEPTSGDVAKWLDAEAGGSSGDELWWVGGEPLGRVVAGMTEAPRLQIRDELDPERAVVSVTMLRRGAPVCVALDLPDAETCARLLRDPFETLGPVRPEAPTRLDVDTAHPIWFRPGGHHLLVALTDGRVAAISVPGSPRAQAGRTRIIRSSDDARLVAAGLYRRRRLSAAVRGGEILLVGVDGGSTARPARAVPIADGDVARVKGELGIGQIVLGRVGHPGTFIAWRSWGMWLPRSGPSGYAIVENLLGVDIDANGNLVVATLDDRTGERRIRLAHSGRRQFVHLDPDAVVSRIYFARGEQGAVWTAIRVGSGRWEIQTLGQPYGQILHGSDESVVGFISRSGPELVLLEDDTKIRVVGRSRVALIASSDRPIRFVTVCSTTGNVAYMTAGGTIRVHSTKYGRQLLEAGKTQP